MFVSSFCDTVTDQRVVSTVRENDGGVMGQFGKNPTGQVDYAVRSTRRGPFTFC